MGEPIKNANATMVARTTPTATYRLFTICPICAVIKKQRITGSISYSAENVRIACQNPTLCKDRPSRHVEPPAVSNSNGDVGRNVLHRVKRSMWEGVKQSFVRRQLLIFAAMLGVGASLMIGNKQISDQAFSEGIALIIVGLVGVLMSWTTFDIGAGIKQVVREVSEKTQEAVREAAKQNQEAMREIGKQTQEAVREAVRDAVREASSNNQVALESLAKSQAEIAKLLQNREKQ